MYNELKSWNFKFNENYIFRNLLNPVFVIQFELL